MIRSKPGVTIIVITALFAAGLLFAAVGHARIWAAQDVERSLDIERYTNEPLEIVDIKVSEQSVKSMIKVITRRNGKGLDNVKFKDKDEWFKRLWVRLRNISGKPITGMEAFLYFKSPGLNALFSLPLRRTKQSERKVLQPNEEIYLTVSDQGWIPTAKILNKYGVDANSAAVTLAVESVLFDEGLQWRRGLMLRRDPDNPNKWVPANKASDDLIKLAHPQSGGQC